MASFTLIRELLELSRDNGRKRLILGLYSASDSGGEANSRKYLALSEQDRESEDAEWKSTRRGITVRRGEVESVIRALQSADFEAKPDNRNLSNEEYAKTLEWG